LTLNEKGAIIAANRWMEAHMKRIVSIPLVAVLAWSPLLAAGNSWKQVRYNGGTLATKVSPKDWGNRLTVAPDQIHFLLKDRQEIKIDPRAVNGLSYGQEAHRRVGTMVTLGILFAPAALFGLFHKTKLHYIGIEYTLEDGRTAGILLQGHKKNYRGILQALKAVTGKEIEGLAGEKK
jgi:hypothetical protein